MKTKALPILLSLIAGFLFIGFTGATLQQDEKKNYFVILYTTGIAWDNRKQPGEKPYFSSHGKFLYSLRKEGTIKLDGRYSDTGMIILQAANSIIRADSAVINQTFNVEIHPINFFYDGCIEK